MFDAGFLRTEPPPSLAWLDGNQFRKMVDKPTWEHHAKNVFDDMKGLKAPSLMNGPTSPIVQLHQF